MSVIFESAFFVIFSIWMLTLDVCWVFKAVSHNIVSSHCPHVLVVGPTYDQQLTSPAAVC